jgi:protein-S-isoprenylcysteine O-methyltransferase Ste14
MIVTLPSNTYGLQIVITLWILSEIIGTIIIPFIRRGGTAIKRRDRGSGLLIFATIIISLALASYYATNDIAPLPAWVFYPGIILMVLGIILRQWSMAILGRFFSGSVATQEGQFVVESGPYRYVRHPSYTGALIILIGLGLASTSWASILSLILLFSLAYGYRIYVEEKALKTDLGENYVEYMKRTKRIIPYLI